MQTSSTVNAGGACADAATTKWHQNVPQQDRRPTLTPKTLDQLVRPALHDLVCSSDLCDAV